jgi:uncharacterized protein YceK
MYRLLGRIFALTVLLSVLSGCGTLFGRGGEYYAPDYYKGTSYDLELLFNGDGVNRGYFPATLWCWISIACPVVTVLSLPIDVVADTLLLPHDARQAAR